MTSHTIGRRAAALSAVAALAALGLAACSGGGSAGPTVAASAPATVSGTVHFWHFFTDREAAVIQSVVDDFEAANPGVKVDVKSGQDDQKMRQAISAGQPVDVGLSYSTDQVGPLCSSGDFVDLAPYIRRDGVDLHQIPDAVRGYTEYAGKRCTMPALADVYGLYYNKKLLSAAGYSQPPKTLDELADMAVKLTTYNKDGSIKTLGFMPLLGYYENSEAHWAPATGAKWLNDDGTSAVSSSPGWAEFFTWQKALIDRLGGYKKLSDFQAALGQEFSEQNDFQTGRVAMNVDGEYRTAFIADQAPTLDYGTAPLPVGSGHTDLYGGGYVTGNIIGIGKGSTNPEAAWALIKYLTTDTAAQVKLTNGLKNVPTWGPALESKDLQLPDQFQTFLDVFHDKNLVTTPPAKIGAEYQTILGNHSQDWQSGKVTDLNAMLKKVDDEINAATQLAG
jgi:multiple sugar transport system substrate-binding protein